MKPTTKPINRRAIAATAHSGIANESKVVMPAITIVNMTWAVMRLLIPGTQVEIYGKSTLPTIHATVAFRASCQIHDHFIGCRIAEGRADGPAGRPDLPT
jgi:hypothetical protein